MLSTSWLRIPITALAAITIAAVAFCEPVAKGLDYGGLAEFVATTSFEDFGNSTEGTVIARFEDMQNDRDPAQVWVYQKGALRHGSVQDFDRAFGGKKQQWPPYTLVFAVTQGKKGHYEVVLKTSAVNTEGNEYEPLPSPDGTRLIVMADGGLHETRKTGTGWSPRVKLGPEVNVNGSEIGAVFSPSGRSLLFSRDLKAPDSGEFFVWHEGGAEAWPPECPRASLGR